MGADVAYWDDAAMEALMPEIEAERTERAAMEEAAEISKYGQEAADYEEKCKRDYWEFLIDYAFAANPSTPGDVLRILARRRGDIAMAVASNPGAPQDLL